MVIATRILKLKQEAIEKSVEIRLFTPVEDKYGNWSCRYEIGWPEKVRTMDAGGVDSIQALLSAMQMIGAELYASEYHKSGRLRLENARAGYGFPVPSNIRDLLEGDDKRFL